MYKTTKEREIEEKYQDLFYFTTEGNEEEKKNKRSRKRKHYIFEKLK